MKTYILLEYKRGITITKLGNALVKAAERDQNQGIDAILDSLEQMDPTTNKQYVKWLCRQYIKNHFRLEDYPRVNDALTKFGQVKSKLSQKDINQYTFHSLEELMNKEFNVELKSDEVSDVPGSKNLYNGPLGRLDVPETEEASKILGQGTKWCTASDENNMFDHYNKQGSLYIWRDKSGNKYQFHFKTYQFMDARDRPIDHELLTFFRTEHPVLKKLFNTVEKNVLTSPSKALDYALSVIKGRWPEGEKVISTGLQTAFLYARDIIEQRFPEGEPILASDATFAFAYVRSIIKGRWPEGEFSILNSKFADQYKKLYVN